MSVVIHRSWEDHATQWTGLSSSSFGCDTLCCNGFKGDHLESAMEEHEISTEDKEEKILLSDDGDSLDCGDPPTSQVSKEIDENDNVDIENQCASSSTHKEAMFCFSANDGEHNLKTDVYLPCQKQENPLDKTLSEDNTTEDCDTQLRSSDIYATAEEDIVAEHMDEIKVSDLDFLKEIESKVSTKELICDDGDLEEIDMPGREQLLRSARVAQQRRKSDISVDDKGQNICDEESDDLLNTPFACVPSQLETKPRSDICSGSLSICQGDNAPLYVNTTEDEVHVSTENLQGATSRDSDQCLQFKDHISVCGDIYGQVRLRRKKVRDALIIFFISAANIYYVVTLIIKYT